MVCREEVVEHVTARVIDEFGKLELRECRGGKVGFMVALEGIDGSGVSTHSRLVVDVLKRVVEGGWYRVLYSKEPTRGPLGFILWEVVQGLLPGLDDPPILALLFAADRFYHLYTMPISGNLKGIVDALASGYIVVLDRYKYSSLAYQSALAPKGLKAPMDWIAVVNAYAPPAHILVYLDVDPQTAVSRIARDRLDVHLFENAGKLGIVRDCFLKLVEQLKKKPEYPPENPDHLLWLRTIPHQDCLYPPKPWPHVLVVEEASEGVERDIKETLEQIVLELVKAAIKRDLLTPRK